MITRPGGKGLALEETLKAYFWHAGYFVARGIPFRIDGEDVTDIDLWLYERPAALTRRRLIVDVKNRRSPKVSERLIWIKGLQAALGVDGAIVATTDTRQSARKLARSLNVILLDGDAVSKLSNSEQLKSTDQLSSEEFDEIVRKVDKGRHSDEWRHNFHDARASLVFGMGAQSTNRNLAASAFFGEQTLLAQPNSEQAKTGVRLLYFTTALAAISLDYVLADQAFQSQDNRRKSIIGSIRFGDPEGVPGLQTIRAAIGLARKYIENGNAAAKQIEHGFYGEAEHIPAEIIAEYVARISTSDALFNTAREIAWASTSRVLPSFDRLSTEAKSLLGVVLDFNGISREKIALAWTDAGKPKNTQASASQAGKDAGPLFADSTDLPARIVKARDER